MPDAQKTAYLNTLLNTFGIQAVLAKIRFQPKNQENEEKALKSNGFKC